MVTMSRLLGPAVVAALLATPVLAQQSAPAPAGGAPDAPAATAPLADDFAPDQPDAVAVPTTPAAGGGEPADPHLMLPALTGGPDGSPTALRGNPLPGTSTSIPTANPAPVAPLPERAGQTNTVEDTGIEGQCDPNISVGCPALPVTAGAAPANSGAPAADAAGTGAAPTSGGATTGGTATPSEAAN